MMIGRFIRTTAAVAVLGLLSTGAWANDFAPQIEKVFNEKVRPWLSDPLVIEAIKAQNLITASYTQEQITTLDKQWRAEAKAGSGPLVDSYMNNALSAFLRTKDAESEGLFSELFIMDAKGLNVGQSDLTTDYEQGDEAKWQKTFLVGPDAVFIDDVEFDESSKTFQSQISATIVDPADGKPIGAITVGVAVEKL
jgi:hypothetical protein